MTQSELSKLKIKELQELAKDKGVKNLSKLKKEQLVEILSETDDVRESVPPKQQVQQKDNKRKKE